VTLMRSEIKERGKYLWFKIKEKEKFVKRIVDDIINDNSLENEERYKLKNLGRDEIKSRVYKVLNPKLRPYPMDLMDYKDSEFIRKIKNEFFRKFRNEY